MENREKKRGLYVIWRENEWKLENIIEISYWKNI